MGSFGDVGPAPSRRLVAEGRASCLLDGGRQDAPTLLLLHGLASTSREIFAAVGPPLLESGFRVVAVDRPGYGGSDALPGRAGPAAQSVWLARLVSMLRLNIDVVVAHSFGAAVTLLWATRLAAS